MVAVEKSTGVSNQACFQRVGKTPYGELTGGEESDSSSAPEHRIRNQHRWVLTRALNEPSRSFPSKNIWRYYAKQALSKIGRHDIGTPTQR